jgi:ribosomal protein S18 acetylase RimI-like enzyme
VPEAFLLIALRGWTARVAAMGVRPTARRRGVGRELVRHAIESAEARGLRRLILEVFEQNPPAMRLYEQAGFRNRRRLLGYEFVDPAGREESLLNAGLHEHGGHLERSSSTDTSIGRDLVEIDPVLVAQAIDREADADHPWQLSSANVRAAAPPTRALRQNDDAWALVSNPAADHVSVLSLVVAQSSRRAGRGRRMLTALRARFPSKRWTVPQIVPEGELDAFFTHCGWKRSALNQLEMEIPLNT